MQNQGREGEGAGSPEDAPKLESVGAEVTSVDVAGAATTEEVAVMVAATKLAATQLDSSVSTQDTAPPS